MQKNILKNHQVFTALGNEETLSTIQLDFLLPQKFNLTFIDCNNKHCRPSCDSSFCCFNFGTFFISFN
ncbi:conserved hypothetical protein [Aster yellows witches'-broom phytoplasma AYWB]|uniref:Uncharacterized protein n=1 Tax=Aster yellows witches'-broom phytoplasma (strain AYWB) TaxID=322098 RepID=Q2NK83_AYWBP|nr:hypothetical protein [Aster yellows witches'-broom phytoplasma]ABC65160.1 conserved hypothetical protein [Aster yellows witches'-broom phytoplasma AYWB]